MARMAKQTESVMTKASPRRRSCRMPCWSAIMIWVAYYASTQVTLASEDGKPVYVVVKAARVITVSGEEFSPGVIVIEDGQIQAVGSGLEYPASAKVIKAPRETVTPGLVHPRSRYGLSSYRRTGVHGDQSAESEIYLVEQDFEEFLRAGFTSVGFVPDGEGIVGVASAYRTAGDDDVRLLKADAYVYAVPNWRAQGKKSLRGAFKKAQEEIDKVENARKEWEEKKKQAEEAKKKQEEDAPEDKPEEGDGDDDDTRYNVIPNQRSLNGEEEQERETADGEGESEKKKEEAFVPPKIDPKYQPLVDMIQQKEGARMLIKLDRAADLLHMFDALEVYDDLVVDVEYISRRRTSDLHQVIDKIGDKKLRILLSPNMNYLPYTTFRYNAAAELVRAGATIAIAPARDIRIELRRFNQHIAGLVRAGLDDTDALRAVTLEPATLMGIDKEVGSIEKGKAADLVFWDGDPLDPHGKVNRVMILGDIVWQADKS